MMWQILRDRVLSPSQVWIPSALLVGSASLLMVGGHPLLVLLALFIQGGYAVTGKKSWFFLGLGSVVVASFYFLDQTFWNVGWVFTLLLSLWVSYEMIGEVQGITQQKDLSYKEMEKGVDLWKTRFETLRDKITSDKEVWEGEIEKLEQRIIEKKDEADSLRVLIKISHKETKRAEEVLLNNQGNAPELHYQEQLEELNELRCKYHELELLQSSDQDKIKKLTNKTHELESLLASHQEALKQRQQINESLHTKPAAKPIISLKDLSKKR